MMSILLTALSDFDLRVLGFACSEYGLDVCTLSLQPDLARGAVAGDVGRAFFVVAQPMGVIDVGERVSQLRRLLSASVPIHVCMHRPSRPDRRKLEECGAFAIVTPRDWSHEAVAERVLAELILHATVQPISFSSLWGGSLLMRCLYEEIETIAPLSEPVLIRGETGTGKELVAREIHARSGRGGNILPINLAELTSDLMASELFGHEKGAFTGASTERKGLLAEAENGTVFLDEIGDLDFVTQAKLLRVLEEHKVRPVGGSRWVDVGARILLATHRDLEALCSEGKFRQDLYERIRGFTVHLPPLRDRREDIPLLVDHFLSEFNKKYPGKRHLPPGALEPLFRYSWPGNVRELRHFVDNAAAFAKSAEGPISEKRLHKAIQGRYPGLVNTDAATKPSASKSAGSGAEPNDCVMQEDQKYTVVFDPATDSWRDVQSRLLRTYFHGILTEAGGNKEAARKLAKISRSQFYENLKKVEQD